MGKANPCCIRPTDPDADLGDLKLKYALRLSSRRQRFQQNEEESSGDEGEPIPNGGGDASVATIKNEMTIDNGSR